MFDTVAYVIENKHLAEENAKLAARNAELEQMVAVLMRHEARDDTIKVQRARIAELEAALKQSARVEASLASRIANLMDALEPFADLAEKYGGDVDDQPLWDRDFMPVVGDLRAARAAYLGEKND